MLKRPHARDTVEREGALARLGRELGAALVSLCRQPRYSVPAALSIALGVGASLAVFAVFSALMLRPLPFPEEGRLVRVGYPGASQFSSPDELTLSHPLIERLRQYQSLFESVTGQRTYSARLEVAGAPARWISTETVDVHYFDTLRVAAKRGRAFSAREAGSAAGVVMREGCYREDLGGTLTLGQLLTLDGTPTPLIGLIADEQALPTHACIWRVGTRQQESPPSAYYYQGFARLAVGMTVALAEQRLRELMADLRVESPRGERLEVGLVPLRETLVDAERSWLSLMLAAVFTFLLMACANLAALLATRASGRAHERAVCAALGATRWALARQSWLEALLLAALSAAVGLALARLGVDWANRAYADVLGNLPARIDVRVLGALALLVLTCALVGSTAPWLVLRRVSPIDALRAEGRASEGRGAGRLRRALVVVQVAASVALLIDAGLLVRSLQALLGRDTGFSTEGVVAAKVVLFAPRAGDEEKFFAQRQEVLRQARAVLERVRALPGVRRVGVGRVPFDYASERLRMQLEPGARQPEASVRIQNVGADYFETLGISLLSGQRFGPEHEGWPPQQFAIVSRSFAEQALGVADAVGHRLRFGGSRGDPPPWIRIVGMVEDTLEAPLTDAAPMSVYFPYFAYPNRAVNNGNTMLALSLLAADPEPVMSGLPGAIAEVLPSAPVTEVKRASALVQESIGRRVALSEVLGALALVALALAAIGLAGVASYSVGQRMRELAIRRMLGATERRIRLMVLAETGQLVGAGLVLGAGAAWLSRRFIASFLHGIAPFDPVTYGALAIGASAVAGLAAWVASRPISASTPARTLARD